MTEDKHWKDDNNSEMIEHRRRLARDAPETLQAEIETRGHETEMFTNQSKTRSTPLSSETRP